MALSNSGSRPRVPCQMPTTFQAMRAEVTVMIRNASQRAAAASLGSKALMFSMMAF